METLVALGILGIVVLAQLVALSRRVRNPDIDVARAIYKQMHQSWQAGRDFGRSEWVEDGPHPLEQQWETQPYMPGEIEDDVPYDDERQRDEREPDLMPDGTPAVVPVTEAPRE